MKFLALIVLISVPFLNIQGFYLKNNNEVINRFDTDLKLEKNNFVRERALLNGTSSSNLKKKLNIPIGDVLRLFTKTLQRKLRERAPTSSKNAAINKLLEILEKSDKSRKTRSVPNNILVDDPQTRSDNDWPEYTSKAEFQEYKMMESQHLNSLKQEIKKLDELLHLLQDQQKILTILNNSEDKSNDVNNEKQYLKLLKLAHNLKCDTGLDISKYSKELRAESSVTEDYEPKVNLGANKEVLANLTRQMMELKGLLQTKSSQDKENERYLQETLENQKRKLDELEGIIERIPNNLNVQTSARDETTNRPEVELRNNMGQWVERSPNDKSETIPPQELGLESKPWIGIANAPLPNGQREFGIVGSPLLAPRRNHPLAKSWAPNSRSSNSDYYPEYSHLLRILQENKSKQNPLKDQRGPPIKIQPTVKTKPKMSNDDDDLMENLQKLLLDPSNRESKAKASFNSQSDIEKRLLELQRQLEISEKFNQIENKIAQLNDAETKSLDISSSSDQDLREQIKKLNVQLKRLNKNKVESKSFDDDDLKRELKNLQLRNELKSLQSAIDNLKPKEQDIGSFDNSQQSKDGSFEFQSMLSQLINLDDDGNQQTSHWSGSHLSPAQVQYIKQKMRGYGNGHKRPHSQASAGTYGVPNYPYDSFSGGGGQYDALNSFSEEGGYGNGFGSGGSAYGNKYGGQGYATFNGIYGPYANEFDPYSSSNAVPSHPYGRPYSSYNSYELSKHQSVPYNPSSWSQYSQTPGRPYESNSNQYKPGGYGPNIKPYSSYDNNRNPHDYFGVGQYGASGLDNKPKSPNEIYNGGNGGANYISAKPYDQQQYNKNPNEGAQAQYNSNRIIQPSYPITNPDPPLNPVLPPNPYNKQHGPTQNIFYEPPNEPPNSNPYQPSQDNPSFNVHNIFEQLAYGGGQTEPNNNSFQNYQNSEATSYKTSVNVDAANSAQPYGNSQESPPTSGAYSQQQVGDLKSQIYNLQNVINNLNQPDYVQTTGDRETVYKLDKRITDLKSVINQISVDPNFGEYGVPNQQPPQQQQPPNYQGPEVNNVQPPNEKPDKPNDPNYAPPIQRSLMRRSPFVPLTDFSKVNDAIKATVLHLVNRTKEEKKFKREVQKSELDKQVAMNEFLLQLREMANAINYLSEGLFAPNNNDSDSSSDERKKRDVKQNEIVDLNVKINKLMEVVNCLEKNVQNKMCSCLKNEGVKRRKRENGGDAKEAVNKIASFLSNIVDEELEHRSISRETPVPFQFTHNNPKHLQKKIEELKEQLARQIQNHPRSVSEQHSHRSNPFYERATFYQPYRPITEQPVTYRPIFDTSALYKSHEYYKPDLYTGLRSGDSLVEKIVAKVVKQTLASTAEGLPSFLRQLFGFGLGSLLNFGENNNYGYDDDQSVGYRNSGYQVDYKPRSFGFFGILPMILLRLITGLTSLAKQLQTNKFIRNFLVPVLVAGLSAGLVLFLVWWFTNSSEQYDNYTKNLYVTNGNYYKSNTRDYSDKYKNNLDELRNANFEPNFYNNNKYFNESGYRRNNNYMNNDFNYYKYS